MFRLLTYIFAAALSLLLLQCASESSAGEPGSAGIAKRVTPVRTVQLELQNFSNYLDVTGTVLARNHIRIVVEEGGTLKQLKIARGRYVNAGDTLALLENKVVGAQYQQARAALKTAQLEFDSRKVLFEKKAISRNEYLSSEFALESATAAEQLASARYQKLFITAPIGGLINDRYYDLGAYATPGTAMFELIDNARLRVRAGIAERYLSEIQVGTPVTIGFDAFPKMVLEAKISFVSRSIDTGSRTFQVEVSLPNPERKLAPQMIANVRVLRQTFDNRVVVPLDALVESEDGWHVFLATDSTARKVRVDKLSIFENQVLVDGLDASQELIVVGQQELSNGDPISIVRN